MQQALAHLMWTGLAGQVPRGKYMTTRDACMCGDHVYRHRTCKHMVAVREGREPDLAG